MTAVRSWDARDDFLHNGIFGRVMLVVRSEGQVKDVYVCGDEQGRLITTAGSAASTTQDAPGSASSAATVNDGATTVYAISMPVLGAVGIYDNDTLVWTANALNMVFQKPLAISNSLKIKAIGLGSVSNVSIQWS